MINTHAQKNEATFRLQQAIEDLLNEYQNDLKQLRYKEISPINVDEIASKMAKVYERIRKIVDWKEENVLRRSAILRILKRTLVHKLSNFQFNTDFDINQGAESLIRELIRGGHLPNDTIPSYKIEETAEILHKYIYILEHAPFEEMSVKNNKFLLKEKVNFFNWFLELCSTEIEECLVPPVLENALIKCMTVSMNARIRILPKDPLAPEQKKTLVYIATCRTLYDLDDSIIAFNVLKHYYPGWIKASPFYLENIAKHIFTVKEGIENGLSHPLSRKFFNICENTDTVFTLIGDIFEKYKSTPEQLKSIFINKPLFKELLIESYQKRYKTLKTRLFRMAVLSTFSVVLANIITYFEVELPIAFLLKEKFSLFATIIDFLIPSSFMFLLVSLIRPPSADNLYKVIALSERFVYYNQIKDIYEIKLKSKFNPIFRIIVSSLYTAACLIMFWYIGLAFFLAGIPISSVVLDTATIGLNIFAALVIRNKSRELSVSEKSTVWEFIIDIFTTPLAEVGSWFASKWKEYNIFSVFLNFFLETPLVGFFEFIEEWRHFLKDKKADIH